VARHGRAHHSGQPCLCAAMSPCLLALLTTAHDVGHEGIQKTLHRLRVDFHIPSAHAEVQDHMQSCSTCQWNKGEQLHSGGPSSTTRGVIHGLCRHCHGLCRGFSTHQWQVCDPDDGRSILKIHARRPLHHYLCCMCILQRHHVALWHPKLDCQ
jgi:hypothetical protein